MSYWLGKTDIALRCSSSDEVFSAVVKVVFANLYFPLDDAFDTFRFVCLSLLLFTLFGVSGVGSYFLMLSVFFAISTSIRTR